MKRLRPLSIAQTTAALLGPARQVRLALSVVVLAVKPTDSSAMVADWPLAVKMSKDQ